MNESLLGFSLFSSDFASEENKFSKTTPAITKINCDKAICNTITHYVVFSVKNASIIADYCSFLVGSLDTF